MAIGNFQLKNITEAKLYSRKIISLFDHELPFIIRSEYNTTRQGRFRDIISAEKGRLTDDPNIARSNIQ
jgi:hypothetical protein